jgi:hypothetical protein
MFGQFPYVSLQYPHYGSLSLKPRQECVTSLPLVQTDISVTYFSALIYCYDNLRKGGDYGTFTPGTATPPTIYCCRNQTPTAA